MHRRMKGDAEWNSATAKVQGGSYDCQMWLVVASVWYTQAPCLPKLLAAVLLLLFTVLCSKVSDACVMQLLP